MYIFIPYTLYTCTKVCTFTYRCIYIYMNIVMCTYIYMLIHIHICTNAYISM